MHKFTACLWANKTQSEEKGKKWWGRRGTQLGEQCPRFSEKEKSRALWDVGRTIHPGLPRTGLLFPRKDPPPRKMLRSKQAEMGGHRRGGGEGAGEAEKVTRMWVDSLIGDRIKRWFSFDASVFFFPPAK